MNKLDSPKILIVDDRPENLFALERVLGPLSARVFTAQSGNEALSLMLRHDFAVTLLDVQMPIMDGFETASLMRENESTKCIPIIFVTAISKDEEHVFRGYEAGAVDYLFKPINSSVLIGKINVFLELYCQKKETLNTVAKLEREIAERKRTQQELRNCHRHLEEQVQERTQELRMLVNTMSGREVRMAELKKVIRTLRTQLKSAGLKPEVDDPLKNIEARKPTSAG